jgi:hypothetical protein
LSREADKADHGLALNGHLHLWLAVFDGLAPIRLALLNGRAAEFVHHQDVAQERLRDAGVHAGDGLGVAHGGRPHCVGGHSEGIFHEQNHGLSPGSVDSGRGC